MVERDVKIEWRSMIKKWHADPSQSNPYTLSCKGKYVSKHATQLLSMLMRSCYRLPH
jgi:hypothetical protein